MRVASLDELPEPQLSLAQYRLRFITSESVRLPAYAGSAWRGMFGRALKRLVCVTREPVCSECLLFRSCTYPYIFETPPDPAAGAMRKYTAAPHPFVLLPQLDTDRKLPVGAPIHLDVTLFGRGHNALAYIIYALEQAGRRGIGSGQGRLALQQVDRIAPDGCIAPIYAPGQKLTCDSPVPPPLPACPDQIKVCFETPLRLRHDGHNVIADTFEFGTFFSQLLRRISLLTKFHTDTPLETEFAALVHAARAVPLASKHLGWRDWTRYSSRQQTTMQLGGMTGHFSIEGVDLKPFWSYLWLGQWTHAGRNTSMGLGKYHIERTTTPCEPDISR